MNAFFHLIQYLMVDYFLCSAESAPTKRGHSALHLGIIACIPFAGSFGFKVRSGCYASIVSVGREAALLLWMGCTRRARGELQPGKPFALWKEKRAAAAVVEQASDERTSVLLSLPLSI